MANQFKGSLAIQLIEVFVPDNSVADHFDVWSDKCQRSFKKIIITPGVIQYKLTALIKNKTR